MGQGFLFGLAFAGLKPPSRVSGLGKRLESPCSFAGDLRRYRKVPGHLLQSGQLDLGGENHWPRQTQCLHKTDPFKKGHLRLSLEERFPGEACRTIFFGFLDISNPGGKSVLNDLEVNNLTDLQEALDVIRKLLNLLEALRQENLELKRQNQELRDESKRLKGEQGKPKIKPNKKTPGQYSSEKERKKPRNRKKHSKKDHIKTHTSQICSVDKSILPDDARFKG